MKKENGEKKRIKQIKRKHLPWQAEIQNLAYEQLFSQ